MADLPSYGAFPTRCNVAMKVIWHGKQIVPAAELGCAQKIKSAAVCRDATLIIHFHGFSCTACMPYRYPPSLADSDDAKLPVFPQEHSMQIKEPCRYQKGTK